MKGTEHFKRTIQMYLEQRAAEDTLFAKNYRNPAKNIDDCVTYILNYVQRSGCNGFTDGEIFGQLRISPRTLQTLRDRRLIGYSQINRRFYYKPEEVKRLIPLVGTLYPGGK